MSQLASLSALAEQTASAFPDLDDPSDLEGEVGDRTVMRPDMLPPAGLNEDSSQREQREHGQGRWQVV